MKETIVVNGKTYPAKEATFNFVCDLGMNDIGFEDLAGSKMMPAVRYYIAYCMGTSFEKAGEIMEQYFINSLNEDNDDTPFTEIIEIFNEKIVTSGFFRVLNKTAQKETPKSNSKKKEKEVSE